MQSPMRGAWLIVGGALTFLVSQVVVYGIRRNALYGCMASPPPEGALPYEGGPAGFDVVQLPVAGVNCWWNTWEGDIITTFHPEVFLSVLTYAAFAMFGAGVIVAVAEVRRRFREGTDAARTGGA